MISTENKERLRKFIKDLEKHVQAESDEMIQLVGTKIVASKLEKRFEDAHGLEVEVTRD